MNRQSNAAPEIDDSVDMHEHSRDRFPETEQLHIGCERSTLDTVREHLASGRFIDRDLCGAERVLEVARPSVESQIERLAPRHRRRPRSHDAANSRTRCSAAGPRASYAATNTRRASESGQP